MLVVVSKLLSDIANDLSYISFTASSCFSCKICKNCNLQVNTKFTKLRTDIYVMSSAFY
jgi:hypothetical protein